MLKKADPVPIAAPSLDPREVNEDDQRWTVEDRHLGHIEKRPQLGKLPFLAEIKNMRPPSPPSPMPNIVDDMVAQQLSMMSANKL